MPFPLPGTRCALTAPFHPCRSMTCTGRRFAFCGTVPGVAPAGRYPAPCFRGARTFLPPGVAARGATIRPSGERLVVPPRTGVNAARSAEPRSWRVQSSSASSQASRCRHSASNRPSTRAGRKWRWKAVTTAAVEESPGSTGIRCRLTAGGGDPRESATENKPPARQATGPRARVKRCGKSAPRPR